MTFALGVDAAELAKPTDCAGIKANHLFFPPRRDLL
jgi:hypothetical protein